jgi:GH25 family lysozyme M1 (1,4-beta-N-acetylmuramidase)
MRIRFPVLVLALVVASVGLSVGAPAAHAAWAVTGIDVSHWQGDIDWTAVAGDERVDFAIIKATEGRSYVDPEFATNATGALANGIVIGAYHVWTPSDSLADARKEADHYLDVAAPAAGNVIPTLDMELNRIPQGLTPDQLLAWARAWVNRVTNRLGARPMVYGSQYLFETKLANTTWFADHGIKLWFAWPRTPLPETMPANDWQGQGWTFWQWTWSGSIDGIEGNVDRDRFAGSNLVTAKIASITAQPGAGGTIADGAGRLDCAAGSTCTELYSPGDVIQLTAAPADGYQLVSWGGACTSAGAAPTCTLTSLGSKTVTATFEHPLTVTVDGDGIGKIMSSPAGIDCPGTCDATFPAGSTVTLTATPDQWSGLTWSGDCTGSDPNGCAVTMDAPRAVTATFEDVEPATATIQPPRVRSGPVRVSFDEPVHRVTKDNVVVRPKGGSKLDGTLRCFRANGTRTPCATGLVRLAVFDPSSYLQWNRTYVAIVNPVGIAPIVDRAGKPTPRTRVTFSYA